MAVVTAPGSRAAGRRQSLIGKLASAIAVRRKVRPARLIAAVEVARQHVVTVAALASVDIGAFHGGPVAGWIVAGVSLLVLDFAVTG